MNTPEHIIEVDGTQRELFFLRGHMKSGTNWVCELLNQHPAVSCRGEYHFLRLTEPLRQYSDQPWLPAADPAVAEGVRAGFREMVRQSLATHVREAPGATRLGDRTPEPLEELLPGGSIIHVVRDGRDMLVSYMFHKLRQATPAEGNSLNPELQHWRSIFREDPHYFTKHPDELFFNVELARDRTKYWGMRVTDDRDFIKRCELGGVNARVLSLSYEQLHANTAELRDQMYRFLGLDPLLAAPIESSETAVAGFGDRGEQPGNFYRAGRVGDWRTYFTPEVKAMFEEEAGEALRIAGYEQSSDWVTREEDSAAAGGVSQLN